MSNRFARSIELSNKTEIMLQDLPEVVQEWYYSLVASNRSPRTCNEYVRAIKKFNGFCKQHGINDYSDLTEKTLTMYMIGSQTKQNKDGEIEPTSFSYRKSTWSVLNSFVTYLYKREVVKKNYMENVARPRNSDDVKRYYLTETDFRLILDCVRKEKYTTSNKPYANSIVSRNVLIFMIFMATGMRRTALSDINMEDIDMDRHVLTITDKGNVEHHYYLDDPVMEALRSWLFDRNNILEGKPCNALFVTCDKNRLSDKTVYDIVKKYTGKALGYEISPHKLRAGFCTILYDKTKDIKFVSKAVGHRNVGTTQIYIQTDNTDQIKAAKMMGGMFA